MTDVLTEDEIDQLLTAINAGEPDDNLTPKDTRKIKIYDFKRPDKFSRDQLRTLSMIHEDYSRSVTTLFSDFFKTEIHVRVASVGQLTYEEFIRCIPHPSSLWVIGLKPPWTLPH